MRAARQYGLKAEGWRKEIHSLSKLDRPFIVFWNFNHFLVVEGTRGGKVFLNDPATGPRTVTMDEFDRGFTGVVLTFEPTGEFRKGGRRPGILTALWDRLKSDGSALGFVVAASVGLKY